MKQGNYYTDWYLSFLGIGFLPVGLGKVFFMKTDSICVVPHEAIDFSGRQTIKFVIKNLHKWIFYTFMLHTLKRKRLKIIFLSKNDYKDIDRKSQFVKKFENYILVTHTKSAIQQFEDRGVNVRWLPFGWSKKTLSNRKHQKKEIFLGFRGNANKNWLDYDRDKIFKKFKDYSNKYSIDVKISHNGEHFLHGEQYYHWLEKCKFQLNSESANGTTSPRIFEQMVLEVCPVAIPGTYEGLILPYENYIPISTDLNKTFADMENDDLVERIKRNNTKLASDFEIGTMARKLLDSVFQ